MMGHAQMQWLQESMQASRAEWQVLAQQVMMAPLLFNLFGSWKVINPDQWDGYPAERKRLLSYIRNNNIQNLVVLTGDIHTSWASNIPFEPVVPPPAEELSSYLGVEFVGTSVTSASGLNLPGLISEVRYMNPHIQFADLEHHGYYILDITPERAQADWYFVNRIDRRKYRAWCARSFMTRAGSNRLEPASEPVAGEIRPALPPREPVSKNPGNGLWILSTSTEKESSVPVIQYYTSDAGIFDFYAYDPKGQRIYQTAVAAHKGLNYCHFRDIPPGQSVARIQCIRRKSRQEASILPDR